MAGSAPGQVRPSATSDTALEQNRDLRTAAARIREYRALVGVARGPLFPSLSANG